MQGPNASDMNGRGISLLLAATAGAVDAIGYMTLFRLFTAHMSGNSVSLAIHVGLGHWAQALEHGFVIPVFLAGVGTGALVTDVATRRGWPKPHASALAMEIVALAAFMVLGASTVEDALTPGSVRYYALGALVSGAMGLQNATVRRVAGASIRTTFVTGMIVDATEELVALVLARGEGRPPPGGTRGGRVARLKMLIWSVYMAGGVAAVALQPRFGFWSMGLPLAGTLAAFFAPGWNLQPRP